MAQAVRDGKQKGEGTKSTQRRLTDLAEGLVLQELQKVQAVRET